MFKKLLPYIGKYKKETILTPVMVAGEVLMEVLIPFLMAWIIDYGLNENPEEHFLLNMLKNMGVENPRVPFIAILGGCMILMALISLVFGALGGRYAAVSGCGFAANLREAEFRRVQAFSFANVDKFTTASLVTRMTTDIMFTRMTFTTFTRSLARSPLMLIGSAIMAFTINARLSLIFLIAVPVLAAVIFFISTHTHPLFLAMFKKYDKMNEGVQENLIGIRVVKAFVRGKHEMEHFELTSEDVMNAERRAQRLMVFMSPVMQLSMYACMIAIAYFGGNQIVAGEMTTGQLMGFISYINQILISLMMISMAFVTFMISRASMERIVEVLDEVPDISDENADESLTVRHGGIVFDHVDFSYFKDENNLHLENVSLMIQPGSTVGIIGGTGSSKSTLVNLIARLYDVTDGRVLVGGKDVRAYKLKTLREAVAMVLQKNTLFSGTIRENLRWGNENATDEEIEAACRAACAHEFVTSFPDGYDTDLSQGGVNLSGGQKQRLCIARALLKKPKILILDDSTSAVDVATDASIRAALAERRGEMTTIIIAQRITSVMDADQIIVLDDGKVSAVGKHEKLLETNDIYREVYEAQLKGREEGGEIHG
ncbi:MAG: ABC transporter ATP-binding protein [Clostridia bacterium]|nr:ABC transporter ATP-binding protein [Clostridia bacterium]